MDPFFFQTFLQLGPSGAAIMCVVLFLRFLRWQQGRINMLIENHMSHNIQAQEKQAHAMQDLAQAVREMKAHCERIQGQKSDF